MEIAELYGVEAAATARGHVVVIDVLRAFTCAAYALAGGAKEIVLAGTVDEAVALYRARPGSLLIGQGRRDEAHLFGPGNSPHALTQMKLRGRTIVQRTGNGTQGVVAAAQAEAVYLASLVNASATARHLRAIGAETVSVLAMGSPPGGPDGPEDVACRDLIAARLRRVEPDVRRILHVVETCPAAEELRDPARGVGRPEDLDLALDVDAFDFAMVVRREGGVPVARRVDVRVRPSAATALPFGLARVAARRRLGRISTRRDVAAAVEALVAADVLTREMCVLAGGTGAPTAEDFDLLDRALATAGVVVDCETAALVESLAIVSDLRNWRITPAAARVSMPQAPDFGDPAAGLDVTLWNAIASAGEAWHSGGADQRIVEVALEILHLYGPALRLGSGVALSRARRRGSGKRPT